MKKYGFKTFEELIAEACGVPNELKYTGKDKEWGLIAEAYLKEWQELFSEFGTPQAESAHFDQMTTQGFKLNLLTGEYERPQ